MYCYNESELAALVAFIAGTGKGPAATINQEPNVEESKKFKNVSRVGKNRCSLMHMKVYVYFIFTLFVSCQMHTESAICSIPQSSTIFSSQGSILNQLSGSSKHVGNIEAVVLSDRYTQFFCDKNNDFFT